MPSCCRQTLAVEKCVTCGTSMYKTARLLLRVDVMARKKSAQIDFCQAPACPSPPDWDVRSPSTGRRMSPPGIDVGPLRTSGRRKGKGAGSLPAPWRRPPLRTASPWRGQGVDAAGSSSRRRPSSTARRSSRLNLMNSSLRAVSSGVAGRRQSRTSSTRSSRGKFDYDAIARSPLCSGWRTLATPFYWAKRSPPSTHQSPGASAAL